MTIKQRKLIESFYEKTVNGSIPYDFDEFVSVNCTTIDNMLIRRNEVEDIILQCHLKRCLSVDSSVGVSPYTNLSTEFLNEETEYRIQKVSPVLHYVYVAIKKYYVEFNTMFTTLTYTVQNSAASALEEKVIKRTKEIVDVAAKRASQKAMQSAEEAQILAMMAAESAKRSSEVADDAAHNAAQKIADRLKTDLSKASAETSVTVLGIFAAIVITIVAGLVFANSVMENINNASVFRLLLGTSAIGFICFNLVSTMIRYINKFTEHKPYSTVELIDADGNKPIKRLLIATKNVFKGADSTTLLVNIILTIFIVVATVGTCITDFSGNRTDNAEGNTNDNNISVSIGAGNEDTEATSTSHGAYDTSPIDGEQDNDSELSGETNSMEDNVNI